MGSDIASRIKARLSRRRQSATPSLASTRSDTDATHSITNKDGGGSGDGGRRAGSVQSREHSSSLHAPSQTRLVDRRGSDVAADDQGSRGSNRQPTFHSEHTGSSGISRSWVVTKADDGDGEEANEADGTGAGAARAARAGSQDDGHAKGGDAGAAAPAGGATNGAKSLAHDGGDGAAESASAPPPATAAGAPNATNTTAASEAAASGAGDHVLGSDLRPKPSHSPLLQPSNLHSINEDSTSTHTTSAANTDTDTPDYEPLHHAGNEPDGLNLDYAHTPATTTGTLSCPTVPTVTSHPQQQQQQQYHFSLAVPPTPGSSASNRPPPPPRRQSLISNRHSALIKSLLHSPLPNEAGDSSAAAVAPIDANMVTRKIWVKRPGASATLVTINEDDVVDDVRDMILRKYANSLGRTFDAPDLAIRIHPRDQGRDRTLGPEEHMCRTLDTYFPGGQTVDDALVIDIPRRTPKASPRLPPPHTTAATTIYYTDDGRPSEAGEGYFPPVGGAPSSPHLPLAIPAPTNGAVPHSIAVLSSGHIPPIPSPGGTRPRAYRDRPDRPRLGRTHTSSPTLITNGAPGPVNPSAAAVAAASAVNHGMPHFLPRKHHSRTHSNSSDQPVLAQNSIPISASPIPDQIPARVATPPPRVSSPRASSTRPKKSKKHTGIDQQPSSNGMLNGTVPPISVLIVEDNPINLKLLEAFVKRLKVRWKTAMNGKEAVKKWRTGGFHLVLMDIQLPGMNGLDATREIRRLERVNSIGVFSSSPSSLPEETNGELNDQDRLETPSLFKSPVIIVALTASSLQSDRHEALAAGCNDFLTKPVNFVWLERKVMEWGCMQALIDFDGWRQWKDFSHEAEHNDAAKKAPSSKAKSKKGRLSISSST